jgi:hypothetical protein
MPRCSPSQAWFFGATFFRDKEHLLAARLGPLERRAGQRLDERARIGAAKNARLGMNQHLVDAMPQAGIPLLAKIIDLGQFGHGKRCAK